MIRPYKKQDYPMLKSWWKAAGMLPPHEDMLPLDTTYICEIDKRPMVSACLYLMNCKSACMIEHVIGNPEYEGIERKNALDLLIWFLELEAKKHGYRVLVLFSYQDKVKARYEDLGFTRTLDNVSTFAKAIGGSA